MNRTFRFVFKHISFLAVFSTLYLVFLYPLFTLKHGFVRGDYGLQFYPWLYAYAQALKDGYLPLWTPLIQCGFPLFAEGQTGMLYVLNLILFKLLPFKAAYNFMFLLHFLMGGVFAYLFGLKKGLSKEASTLASLAFTFGSAYAGCFYNIAAMRSLVWFPLELYLVDEFLERRRVWPLFCLAFVQGQSWLGGFPQMAAYATFFLVVYFGLRLLEEKRFSAKPVWFFGGAGILSFFIALPQIWATFALANQSTRVLQDKSFIFWGSVGPWSLFTLFMYSWGVFLRSKIYLGVGPFLLFFLKPFDSKLRTWWILTGLSLFFAVGVFNPFYWIMVHLPMASLLRNPSKFLFFTAFFLSLIAGFSFDKFCKIAERGQPVEWDRFLGRACKVLVFLLVISAGAWAAAQFGSKALQIVGRWYVETFVIGKSFHQKSPDEYFAGIHAMSGTIQQEVSLRNPFFWMPFLFAGAFILLWVLLKNRKISLGAFKTVFLSLLALDLFVFGKFDYGTGFVGNMGSFPDIARFEHYEKDGKWLDLTQGAEALFPPNRNMLTGHAIAGAYSPLLDKHYYLLLKDSGTLDDSFGSREPNTAFFQERDLISFLGVKYLVSSDDFALEGYPLLRREDQKNIYLNAQAMEEFNLILKKGQPVEKSRVRLVRNEPMRSFVEVDSPGEGILIRGQVYSEDWKVYVDGERTFLARIGQAFQGVLVSKGHHRVEWVYQPKAFFVGRWFYIGGLCLVGLGIAWNSIRHLKKFGVF